MKPLSIAFATLLLAAAVLAGPGSPTLVELSQRAIVVRGVIDEAHIAVGTSGCIVGGRVADLLVEEVIVGDVERGSLLAVGLGRRMEETSGRPREVFAFVDPRPNGNDVVFRVVHNGEQRRSLRRGIDTFHALAPRINDMPVDELKALFLDMAKDPYLREGAVRQMLLRRAGHTPRLGESAPRMRLSSAGKAALVDIVATLRDAEDLESLVFLIGEYGGTRYGRAIYDVIAAHPDEGLTEARKRLARITGSARAAGLAARADAESRREYLDVVRPFAERWARTSEIGAK